MENNAIEQTTPLTNTELLTNTDDGKNKKSTWWSAITLEPMWFGAIASLTMGFSAFQNLFLERACTVDLGYSYDTCFNSNDSMKRQIEMQSQQVVASQSVGSNFVGGFLTCLVLLFLGPWSDLSGRRKPIILLPIIGMITTSIGLLILQAFPNVSTSWALYIEVLPLSITGSNPLLMMAAFSYLGDVCYQTGRCTTTVMGFNGAAISASTIIGSLLSPVLLKSLGFVGVFSISAILELTSFLYGMWKIKDVNVSEKLPNVFNLKLPIQALKCLFKRREGKKRRNVILMVFVPSTTSITLATEMILLYLYLRHKFQWTEVEYGVFAAYRGVIQFFGTIIIVKLLKHKLKLEDRTIGMIGAVSQFIASLMLLMSSKPWMIFLAPILGILNRAVLNNKPVLNKNIIASEQGKLNSITAIIDKIVASGVIPMAHYIYYITIEWMPSFFLFFGLIAAFIEFCCYYFIVSESIELKNQNIPI